MISLEDIKKTYRNLYPTGRAWNYMSDGNVLARESVPYVDGLGNFFVDGEGNVFVEKLGTEREDQNVFNANANIYHWLISKVDDLKKQHIPDNDSFTEDDASAWEKVYGLLKNSDLTLEERKTRLLNRMSNNIDIPERGTAEYIQKILRDNGFDVYVHDNRFVGTPAISQVGSAMVGVSMIGSIDGSADFEPMELEPWDELCANYIDASEDLYIWDELGLSTVGEATVGEASLSGGGFINRKSQLSYSIIIGGATYPSKANIKESRKKEFRELILQLKHAHIVAALYVNYI